MFDIKEPVPPHRPKCLSCIHLVTEVGSNGSMAICSHDPIHILVEDPGSHGCSRHSDFGRFVNLLGNYRRDHQAWEATQRSSSE